MQELPNSLVAFAAYRQFIVFKTVPSETRPGKTDKFPVDYRSGRWPVNAHDPAIWMDAATAIATAAKWGQPFGVGFVFTEADPFWFVDADNCLLPDNTWSPESQRISQLLAGAAMEISRSGRGLHWFGCGRPPAHGCKNEPLGLEFYHSARFVALTGIGAMGNAAADLTAVLPALVNNYFPPDPASERDAVWTSGPDDDWNGPADDSELIRRAMASRSAGSAFGVRASFADLWQVNIQVLSQAYPDTGRPYNESQADAALAQHLAFWTGRDCERIQRLMLESGLNRQKWDRVDYLPRTILKAVGLQGDVLQDKAPEPLANAPASPGLPQTDAAPLSKMVTGGTILNAEAQVQLFSNCVYISDIHKALIPGGRLLKPDQFRVHFGGYSFQADITNERMTRDPWEAWTQSQLFRCPRVDGSAFRPDLPGGVIIERNGRTFVNTYFPVFVVRKVGDPTPFLTHLAKVLPDERDRLILLSFMAACVQHKGVKFQWAPLLQGVEGNGKTLFTRCVAEAVGRPYVHWPKASKLCNQFNSWMVGKLFFAVEDIVVPNSKREIIEELKPMITGGDGLEIEAKGFDQISADICGNFMFNCNPKDGMIKAKNDRRFCIFYTAQQQDEDLIRDGMAGDYFPKLYEWLKEDGYAIVNELLHTFPIPAEFNPAGECQRAPITTSTAEAISVSVGSIEQEIMEAAAQGLTGFSGGWISSIYLDRLLDKMGMRRVSHSKRKDLLEGIGYRWHPSLKDGRVNNPVLPDGGKPRLYIHDSSLAKQIINSAEAVKNYEKENMNRPPIAGRELPFMAHQRGAV